MVVRTIRTAVVVQLQMLDDCSRCIVLAQEQKPGFVPILV